MSTARHAQLPPFFSSLRGKTTALLSGGVIATMILSGCGAGSTAETIQNPTNVLQAVNVHLDSDSTVASVSSSNIFSNEATGKSASKDQDYTTRDVVNDLPVRLTTQYRTGDKSGTDLKDLDGYTGDLTINLTVENLTVAPQEVSYDAGGQKHTTTALVGVPLTVAGSTVLDGITPNQVTGDATSPQAQNDATNGVVSTNTEGKTVIQWSSLLAPPVSGASTTMRLNLKAKDFHAPAFDVAVQPGFSNNLTSEGVLNTAFNNNATSQTALLQRTIDVASQMDQILASAGTQVSEIRSNLNENADTLGKTAAEDLGSSTKKTTETMKDVSGKVDALKKDLVAASGTNKTQLTDQLQTTVQAIDTMLGDTSAGIPSMSFSGTQCSAQVNKPSGSGTVYSNLVQLSGFLNGYAAASNDCQKQLAGSLKSLIGPQKPSTANCTDSSLTCSLYGSSTAVATSLIGLARAGDKALDSLQPAGLKGAQESLAGLDAKINELQKSVDALSTDQTNSDLQKKLQDLKDSIATTDQGATDLKGNVKDLVSSINELHDTAVKAKQQLTGPLEGMESQNHDLAEELCRLDDGGNPQDGKLSSEEVQKLRSYLTDTDCDQSPSATPSEGAEPSSSATASEGASETPATPAPSPSASAEPSSGSGSRTTSAQPASLNGKQTLRVQTVADTHKSQSLGYPAPMDLRLQEQATEWDKVIAQTDTDNQDPSSVGARLKTLQTNLTTLTDELAKAETDRASLDKAATGGEQLAGTIKALQDSVTELKSGSRALNQSLKDVGQEQDEMTKAMKKAFADSSTQTAEEVTKMIDQQVRTISDQGNKNADAVVDAFGRSVAGMTETSQDVVAAANQTVKEQHRDLSHQNASLRTSIDAQTKDSLTQLDQRTSAATRDLAGSATMLNADMNKVLLDLGTQSGSGTGLLGAMGTSAAKADAADYQLAQAQQNAQGYANIRSQDIDGVQLKQAQFQASLKKLATLPGFHLDENNGASVKVLYTFHLEKNER